jgi:DNA-binding transcriptional LysR family regulator
MDLHQLRTFVAIADSGGVARAARRLNLSQPAASRQLSVLEAELGFELFDRIGRGIALTCQGEDLLRRARRLVLDAELLRERARALKAGGAGHITIGATPPMIEIVLAGFLARYRQQHPGIDINVVEDGGAGLIGRLERGEVQLAYVPATDERFSGRLLYPIHVIAVMSDTHPLARAPYLDITRLASEPLLLLQPSFASRQWFDAACQTAQLVPNVRLESGAPHAALGLALAGYGVAILPSLVRLPAKGARAVPLVHRKRSLGQWTRLAWDPRRFQPAFAESFRDALVAYAQRTYPGRDLIRRAPRLRRPAEH